MPGFAPAAAVPAADSVANVNASDVIGNKTDTAAGTSLAARTVVPVADSADNDYTSDVVGNKTDTVAGTSLVALARVEAAARLVPAADAVDNVDVADVVGNKLDTVAGDSVIAILRRLLAGGARAVYPALAAGTTCTEGAAWVKGAWAQVAAAGPANDFVIVGYSIDTPSAPCLYEIDLGSGAGAAEVVNTIVTGETTAAMDGGFTLPCTPGGVIAGGTRLAARVATNLGAATTINVKIHTREV